MLERVSSFWVSIEMVNLLEQVCQGACWENGISTLFTESIDRHFDVMSLNCIYHADFESRLRCSVMLYRQRLETFSYSKTSHQIYFQDDI